MFINYLKHIRDSKQTARISLPQEHQKETRPLSTASQNEFQPPTKKRGENL